MCFYTVSLSNTKLIRYLVTAWSILKLGTETTTDRRFIATVRRGIGLDCAYSRRPSVFDMTSVTIAILPFGAEERK